MISKSTDMTRQGPNQAIPTAIEIRTQLEKIVSNPDFRNTTRLRDFLSFVVNEGLAGRADGLKAYTIGVEVFDRPGNFDPITDTIVRVNAGKLRRTLERYYLAQGSQDRVHISIPKGRYVPLFQMREFEETVVNRSTQKISHHPAISPRLPVVAVLPFRKISIESSREFIINGFGEELTMALSRFSGLKVLAFSSTSALKPEQQDPNQLHRTLDAAFVLTGSVYQVADKLRLNVQLYRTDNSQHVWSQSYDRDFTAATLFSIRDEIVQDIVATVADDYGVIPKIIAAASRGKIVEELRSYEALMRYHHYAITLEQRDFDEALYALEKAVTIDSEYALAWAFLSILYFDAFTFSYADLKNPIERGMEAARKAITLDPFCQHAYFSMCYGELLHRNEEEVIRNANKIIELNPNSGSLVGIAGFFLAMTGRYDKGFQIIREGMRLNPFFPTWFHFPRYLKYYMDGKYSKALETVKALGLPDFFWNPLMQAAALGQLERISEAETAVQELLTLKPNFPEKARLYLGSLLMKDEWVDAMVEGLKKAGLKKI